MPNSTGQIMTLNQKPVILPALYTATASNDFDLLEVVASAIADPVFNNAVVPGQDVTVTYDGNNVDREMVASSIIGCIGDDIDSDQEDLVRNFLNKTLLHYDPTRKDRVQEMFINQSATKAGLQEPVPGSVVYTPGVDIIPSCKGFLAGTVDYDTVFGSFAYYSRTEALGFYFANQLIFDDFKNWFDNQIQLLSSTLDASTNQLCQQFNQLSLDQLTESLILRNQVDESNEPDSFPRLLLSFLMQYSQQNSNSLIGIMPFKLSEIFVPKNIIFINIEKHAHATAADIKNEWDLINKSLGFKLRIISKNKLTKLTAIARQIKKAQSQAATTMSNRQSQLMRARQTPFRKTPPRGKDMLRYIRKVSDKMSNVAKSENVYKMTKLSFARANRRRPDDYNLPGRIISTKYKPDIHIYIDTSGSISVENYEEAMKVCIATAKKLNVNLYFSSFSHVLSQETRLVVRDRSFHDIYKEFLRTPKVGGGTDYQNIWEYINRSKERRRRLSIVVTDFEYTPPNTHFKHPPNLYYAPCGRMDWDRMLRWATSFVKGMEVNVPKIRSKLFM